MFRARRAESGGIKPGGTVIDALEQSLAAIEDKWIQPERRNAELRLAQIRMLAAEAEMRDRRAVSLLGSVSQHDLYRVNAARLRYYRQAGTPSLAPLAKPDGEKADFRLSLRGFLARFAKAFELQNGDPLDQPVILLIGPNGAPSETLSVFRSAGYDGAVIELGSLSAAQRGILALDLRALLGHARACRQRLVLAVSAAAGEPDRLALALLRDAILGGGVPARLATSVLKTPLLARLVGSVIGPVLRLTGYPPLTGPGLSSPADPLRLVSMEGAPGAASARMVRLCGGMRLESISHLILYSRQAWNESAAKVVVQRPWVARLKEIAWTIYDIENWPMTVRAGLVLVAVAAFLYTLKQLVPPAVFAAIVLVLVGLLVLAVILFFAVIGLIAQSAARACLPRGTPIATPAGEVPVQDLRRGDTVLCWLVDRQKVGELVVVSRTRHRSIPTVRIRCGEAEIVTAIAHSLLAQRGWTRACDLRPGDTLFHLSTDVVPARGEVQPVEVTSAAVAGNADVFRLVVTRPQTFICAGFVTHSFTKLRTVRSILHDIVIDRLLIRPTHRMPDRGS